jgi:hypothetical protein
MYENTNLYPLLKLYNCSFYVKISKTVTVFMVSGNSFNMNQFRRNCVVFFVLIVNIMQKIVKDKERKNKP